MRVARDDVVHVSRRRGEPPVRPQSREPAGAVGMDHHGVVHVKEHLVRVAAQERRIGRVQHLALEDHRVIRARGAQQRPPREQPARTDPHIQLEAPPPQRLDQRRDAHAVRGLLEVVRDDQKAFHEVCSNLCASAQANVS
jgi:hypothetical protein